MGFIDTARGPKFFGFVIFDWLLTIVSGYYLGGWIYDIVNKNTTNGLTVQRNNFIFLTIILLVFIGIYIHCLTNTDTMIGYYMGLSNKPIR